ncbi:MAG TPA: YdcF family protein [Casimicrobiaceae bacterium]|nr:YdcF family protein [Casimicrobiaceae bacterium]
MPLLFWLKQIVKLVALPPVAPMLLAFAGLALAGRHPRGGRRLALAGVVALWLLATPIIGEFLIRSLDRVPVLDVAHAAATAQAIVILGGGTRRFAPEYGGATVNRITLERLRYGARIARATNLPVLVSGGAVRGAPPEAILMRNVLVHELGVAVRWVETRSHDTHENAVGSANMLAASGVHRIILVGHSFDFPRSRKEFEAAGMEVIPAPIAVPPPLDETSIGDYLPGLRGLELSYYAMYEILANVLYDVTRFAGPETARAG